MTQTTTLFQRLGGTAGVTAIASDVVDAHLVNPLIKQRFLESDPAALKDLVRDFVSAGTGGQAQYGGRDMRAAHLGLNINERELVAAIDDILGVLDRHGVDSGSRAEMLAILYSFQDEELFL
ncbi:MAG: group 1 truncated hemoglobin [Planctomycetes bacterium]|nr:group 1 truncated hemoglobin [Planctomycetota bacterium]